MRKDSATIGAIAGSLRVHTASAVFFGLNSVNYLFKLCDSS